MSSRAGRAHHAEAIAHPPWCAQTPRSSAALQPNYRFRLLTPGPLGRIRSGRTPPSRTLYGRPGLHLLASPHCGTGPTAHVERPPATGRESAVPRPPPLPLNPTGGGRDNVWPALRALVPPRLLPRPARAFALRRVGPPPLFRGRRSSLLDPVRAHRGRCEVRCLQCITFHTLHSILYLA